MKSSTFESLKDFPEYAVKFAQQIGADWAESRLERTEGTGFGMDNGVPTSSGFDEITGMSVRFLINGAQGFVSTPKFDRTHLSKLITKSIESVRYSSSTVKESIGLSKERVYRKRYRVKPKKDSRNVSESDKIELLSDLHKQMSSQKIPATSTSLSITDFFNQKYYINSDGAKIQFSYPYVETFYFYTVNANNRSAQRWNSYGATSGWEVLKKWDLPKIVVEEVNALGRNAAKAKKAPSGQMNVVVGNEITGIMLHESVGHPYEADRVLGREAAQAGGSFLTPDMIGQRVGSEIVTVCDDPRIRNSAGFYLYDDEGVKARKRVLIKNGKINELYHNRETAYSLGTRSNGASRASAYNREPIVRMANTYVVPGKHSMDELFREAKNGVYIKNFMEWNIDDKRSNFKAVGSEAYQIKNGKLAGPVWRPALEITTDKLWNSVGAVGNKKTYGMTTGSCGKGEPMQGIPVLFGGAALMLKGVKV